MQHSAHCKHFRDEEWVELEGLEEDVQVLSHDVEGPLDGGREPWRGSG